MSEPASGAGAADRTYSRAFENLVQGPDDIVGLLAYALMKQTVREEATRGVRVEGSLRNPSPVTVDLYRSSAERMLNKFATRAIDEASAEIRESALLSSLGEMKSEIVRHVSDRTSAATAIWTNLLAWAVTGIATILIVVGISAGNIGNRFLDRLDQILNGPPTAPAPSLRQR